MLTVQKEDTMHEKNLYKKMLGQDKCPESIPKNNKVGLWWIYFEACIIHMILRFVSREHTLWCPCHNLLSRLCGFHSMVKCVWAEINPSVLLLWFMQHLVHWNLGFYDPRIYFIIDSTRFYSPAKTSLKPISNFPGMCISAFCTIPWLYVQIEHKLDCSCHPKQFQLEISCPLCCLHVYLILCGCKVTPAEENHACGSLACDPPW